MKKLFLLFVLVVVTTTSSFSQTFELISARDAHNFIMSEVEGLADDTELIEIFAYSYPTLGMIVDYESGNAHLWYISFKSKDAQDEDLYEFSVYKMDGEYGFEFEVYEDDYAQEMPTLNPNWQNSTDLAVAYKASNQFSEFYDQVKNDDYFMVLNLFYADELAADIWSPSLFTDQENYVACAFHSQSLNLIECMSNLTSVQEKIERATKLFPNPVNDVLNIEVPFTGEVQLDLYNVNGVVVKSLNQSTTGNLIFNTSDLAVGVYKLVIRSSESTFAKKIVVAR